MSIIVKGKMKMPKNCYGCPFADTTDWERDTCTVDEYEREIFIFTDKRPEWCPLIELPKNHGRLIDGDKLKKEWEKSFYKKIVDALMDDAETFLESEE